MAHNPSVERPSLLACFTAHGESTLYSRGGVPPARRDLTAVEPRRPRLGATRLTTAVAGSERLGTLAHAEWRALAGLAYSRCRQDAGADALVPGSARDNCGSEGHPASSSVL